MNFDLIRLKNNLEEYITIDTTISFDSSYLEKTDLLKLDNVLVQGTISKDSIDNIILDVSLSGTMVLPCSISLKPVEIPFSLEIHGIIDELLQEIDEIAKKTGNSIDILPIIWENILMEIPMKVTSPDIGDIQVSGNGWKLITEEDHERNSPLAKLRDL